jgi:hypothetical protein
VSRSSVYCEECGGRLTLYVVGVCPRCEFDLTGSDHGAEHEARMEAWRVMLRSGPQSPSNGEEA